MGNHPNPEGFGIFLIFSEEIIKLKVDLTKQRGHPTKYTKLGMFVSKSYFTLIAGLYKHLYTAPSVI